MDPRYSRPASPGSRRLVQPGRSSTGTLVYPSSYDPYRGPTQSSRELNSGPRTSVERVITPRVVPHYKPDSSPARKLTGDYPVRPRRVMVDPEPANNRRPLSVVTPSSPNRARPIITSALDRPSSPLAKASRQRRDEDYYIQPASTSSRREHRRYNTVDSLDTSRLAIADRDGRDRIDRGGYRSSGSGGGRSGYNLSQPLVRQSQDKEHDGYGYEYTDRREQMYRDTAPRPRPRTDSFNGGARERPRSMVGLEGYIARPTISTRDGGPPVSTRGFGTMARSESLRQDKRTRDDSAPRDYGRDGYESSHSRAAPRPQVALHHPVDDGYPPYPDGIPEPYDARYRRPRKTTHDDGRGELAPRDPYEDHHERSSDDRSRAHNDRGHHRKHDDKDERDYERERDRDRDRDLDRRARDEPVRDKRDRGGEVVNNGLLAGAAGLTAAGISTEAAKHRHRHKEPHDRDDPARDSVREGDRNRPPVVNDTVGSTSRSTEASDEERRERRRIRHRERDERKAREAREAKEAVEEDARRREAEKLAPPQTDKSLREQISYERSSQASGSQPDLGTPLKRNSSSSRRHHHSRSKDVDSYSDSSSSSSLPSNRQLQVRVVTPSQDQPDPLPAVKSILRQPREKFPEDPAPIREGVAPLKDATKKGIPPNARWTKIDRKLVNPEALEEGNERYEERTEYVIVLRVLTKEEIQEYAAKTQEIRGRREMLTQGGGDGEREREREVGR